MLQAYFESLKYVGHLLPIAFLRIFLGYFYLVQAFKDWKTHVLGNAVINDFFIEALSQAKMPYWYRFLLSEHLLPHWNIYAFILVGVQFLIGLSYILGYVVRPTSILALVFCLNYFHLKQQPKFKNNNKEISWILVVSMHTAM